MGAPQADVILAGGVGGLMLVRGSWGGSYCSWVLPRLTLVGRVWGDSSVCWGGLGHFGGVWL